MNTQNTVTARRATREVKTVVTQKQDMIVLEMSLEVAQMLRSCVASISTNGPVCRAMADVFGALGGQGVPFKPYFSGRLYEIQ